MMKSLAVAYGAFAYALFLMTFLYAIGFVGDFGVSRTIDSGVAGSPGGAILIDALLLAIFAIQHSVMARPAFKAWWTRLVPPVLERSTYVLFASLALALLLWQWRPLPTIVWTVQPAWAVYLLWALFWLGFATVLMSTFLINHFDLFGLRQVWAYRRNRQIPPSDFRTPLFYRVVRHPLYLGFIVAFWAAPVMTQGHLLFAAATTAYTLIAIQFEEHDLLRSFGQQYEAYIARVPMLLPLPRRR